MRLFLMVVLALGCSSMVAGRVAGQVRFPVQIGEGLTVTGDFDGDGCDDVLVMGRDNFGQGQTYFGRKSAPYLVAGPTWTFTQWWDISDAPVFHGGVLYVPVNIKYSLVTQVQRFRLINGRWTATGKAGIFINTSQASINSLKITPTSRDLDGDKQPDILAVWGEAILQSNRTFHAAYISASGVHREAPVPRIPAQPSNTEVADVHVSRSLGTAAGAEEYIVILSGPSMFVRTGIGVLTIGTDLAAGKGMYGTGMPPVNTGLHMAATSASCYGKFGRDKNFGTPLIQLRSGEGLIPDPGLLPPYIMATGEILHSSTSGIYFDQATADYDGDGIDEVVLAENTSASTTALLYIADPTSKRRYTQVFNLAYQVRGATIYHGARGDFNGDGIVDLVVSYWAATQGYLALFLADRSKGPGKPALRRVY